MTDAHLSDGLDPVVIEHLADLICGDEPPLLYRTGYDIERFFKAAGWTWVDGVDSGRRRWVVDQLRMRNDDPSALRRVLLRLADPREYIGEDEAYTVTTDALDELLALEGLQVLPTPGGPELIHRTPASSRITSDDPLELDISLRSLVNDEAFGIHLSRRLDEARTCWRNGATTAAIIMLGSLLEGVLYDVAVSRGKAKIDKEYSLAALIDIARRQHWVAQEMFDYMTVVRHHRNLVHPRKHVSEGYNLDDDTVRISWNVVVGALNALSKTTPSNN